MLSHLGSALGRTNFIVVKVLVQPGSQRLLAIFRLLMSSPRRSRSYHTSKPFLTPELFIIQLLVLWRLTYWYSLLQNTETTNLTNS